MAGDFIVAVNVGFGWKNASDAAPAAVPVFLLLWASLTLLGFGMGKRGALNLAFVVWGVASAVLPVATLAMFGSHDPQDPIFPPLLILPCILALAFGLGCGGIVVLKNLKEGFDQADRIPLPWE